MTVRSSMPEPKPGLWRAVVSRMERAVCNDGDDQETRQRKALSAAAVILVVPAGVVWGGLYFAFGERTAAAIPVVYSALTLVDLLVLVRLQRYELFRQFQQLLILLLPFALQLALGGFVGGSGVIIWSFIAVLTALLFGGRREAAAWFAAFACAVVAVAVLQPGLTVDNELPDELVVALFVLNFATVSLIASIVLHSFVDDRRKLRELEIAYLDQELALRQSEKMATLGTLAAGVAHELNNPAAATRRAADQLRDAVARLERAQLERGSSAATPAGRDLLQALERRAQDAPAGHDDLDPLERSDRELALEEWLAERQVPDAGEQAASLVAQGLDADTLSQLADGLEPDELAAVVSRAASIVPVHALLHEIGEGSSRISDIVGALRSYSYLGQAPVQMVDLHQGLDNTLIILRGKTRDGVQVRRDYDSDLPLVPAHGSELNQVWTNLLDNAIDAMGGRGEITIRTRREGEWAVVEIEDDGPGIPDAIRPRIFDPFFTTKEPGKGTGLGLSTSFSIVADKHKGRLSADSRPGLTRFTVRLPLDA